MQQFLRACDCEQMLGLGVLVSGATTRAATILILQRAVLNPLKPPGLRLSCVCKTGG